MVSALIEDRKSIEEFKPQWALWVTREKLQGNKAAKLNIHVSSYFRSKPFHFREETTVNRETPFLHLLAFLSRLTWALA